MIYVKIWTTKNNKRVVALFYENEYVNTVLTFDMVVILKITGWSYGEYATKPDGLYNF